MILDAETGEEIPNFSNPSKKQIVAQALLDLGETIQRGKNDTLYQLINVSKDKIKINVCCI